MEKMALRATLTHEGCDSKRAGGEGGVLFQVIRGGLQPVRAT